MEMVPPLGGRDVPLPHAVVELDPHVVRVAAVEGAEGSVDVLVGQTPETGKN